MLSQTDVGQSFASAGRLALHALSCAFAVADPKKMRSKKSEESVRLFFNMGPPIERKAGYF